MKEIQSYYIGVLGEGGMIARLKHGKYVGYEWSIEFGNSDDTYPILEALTCEFPKGN